jgi:riboflavin kinase/FMN adenylyltransferase
VRCGIGKSAHFGMMNIGQRPTLGGMHQTIEVYVLNFNRDIYGEIVEITVLEKIRDERSFSSLEALKDQLTRDEAFVRTYCIDG